RAVLSHQPLVSGGTVVGDRLGKLLLREPGGAVFLGEKVGRGGGEELGLLVAEHAADALVPAPVTSLVVHDEDRVVLHLVGGGAVALLGAALGLLGGFPRGNLAPEL